MDKKTSKKILNGLAKRYGPVKPDLKYRNIYQLTIAVVLSAQTTDVQVNGVTPLLFEKYPDFASLAGAGIPEIEELIRSTGFYRNKAKNIVSLSKEITGLYKGRVPRERKFLMKLPGVGRKSANVILSMGHNIPALAVDTHVSRIAGRLGYTLSDNPDAIERDLCSYIPEEDWTESHLLFIRHGRSICRARNPLCGECPVIGLCPSSDTFS